MFIWLSMQIWQLMFGVQITGDALAILQVFGFLELFVEICVIVAGTFIWLSERKK